MLDQTDGVLIFCDLLGGTPFNQAMMLSQNYNNVEVVTGTNLPMLLETLSLRLASTTLTDLLQTALESGIAGVSHKTLELPAVVEPALDDDSSFENDGI